MRHLLIILLIVISNAAISPHSSFEEAVNEKKNDPQGNLLLKSGFEEGVGISDDMMHIKGADINGYKWDDSPAWIASSRFEYVVGKNKDIRNYMEAEIETAIGPYGQRTRVLRLTNIKDDEDLNATSRIEFSFFGKDTPFEYRQGYVKYWMKLQENLNELIDSEAETPFYMIMEWKEPNAKNALSADQCEKCCNARAGGTNNYRINIGIVRLKGEEEFSWKIRGEQPQPCRIEEWSYVDQNVRVPLGEWFLVEAFMKKHATNGRIYFAINNQIILDTDKTKPEGFTGRTQHADHPLDLGFWSPMKNYHSMQWNKKGPISQWYDDFELWSDFPFNY